MPKNNAGSARHANVTSRAPPMPSNDEPVSSAAATVKNRPSPSTYANTTKSPANAIGARWPAIGTSSAAVNPVARPTTGPARKIHVVVVLNTAPLRSSFTMS